jgi:hypothetical protein
VAFEKVRASQVISFAPGAPSYTQTVLAAGIAATGAATGLHGSGALPYVIIPPYQNTAGAFPPQPGDVFQLWSGGVLKEPTLFQVASVLPESTYGAWKTFFFPLPAATPVGHVDQVISLRVPKSPRWFGTIGHVTGLKYSFTCPGGPAAATWTLQVPPYYRTDAMNPGRVVQIMRGGSCVWDGILDEPQPAADGWAISAHGAGTFGTDFGAFYTAWGIDDPVNHAISRGLRWINPGIGSPSGAYLAQVQDSGSETITDHLNLICNGGSLLWDVQPGQGSSLPAGPWQLRVFPYPTDAAGNPNGAPTRLLVSTTPVARTIAADINTIMLRYQATADIPATNKKPAVAATFAVTTASNGASVRAHGNMEYFVDITSAGVVSGTQAQAIGNNILSRYVRANFAGPFTVAPGQYLNPGGVPVDLGCERAGEVAQLIVTDGSYGGEVGPAPLTFLVGTYEYDNDTNTATVTPFAGVRRDMASLVTALYPSKF